MGLKQWFKTVSDARILHGFVRFFEGLGKEYQNFASVGMVTESAFSFKSKVV